MCMHCFVNAISLFITLVLEHSWFVSLQLFSFADDEPAKS